MKLAKIVVFGGLLALLTSCSFSTATPTSPPQSKTPPVQSAVVEAVTATITATPSPTLAAQATATAIPATAEATPTASATASNEISPTASPPPVATPTTPPAETAESSTDVAGCTDIASYYEDVTVVDGTTFRQGESFVKTWRIRNEGTCTWDASYSLVYGGGAVMNADLANPIREVPPGTITDISVELTAPSRGGTYQSNWELQNGSGERFGVGTGQPARIFTWAILSSEAQLKAPSIGGGTVRSITITCSTRMSARSGSATYLTRTASMAVITPRYLPDREVQFNTGGVLGDGSVSLTAMTMMVAYLVVGSI
jgi:hypothetical protein